MDEKTRPRAMKDLPKVTQLVVDSPAQASAGKGLVFPLLAQQRVPAHESPSCSPQGKSGCHVKAFGTGWTGEKVLQVSTKTPEVHLTCLHRGQSGSRGTENHVSLEERAQHPREGDAASKHRCFWATCEQGGERRWSHPGVPGIAGSGLQQGLLLLRVGALSRSQTCSFPPPKDPGPPPPPPVLSPRNALTQVVTPVCQPQIHVEMKEVTLLR